MMRPFRSRLRGLFSRRRRQADLADELGFHLETDAEERQAAGAGSNDAKRAARLDLGNVAIIAEDTRAAWGWTGIERLIQDIRFALRVLLKSRVFTVTALLCLALGIGANTLLYSLTDAILLRELPVNNPRELVRMTWKTPRNESHGLSRHASSIRSTVPGAGFTSGVFSHAALELFAQHPDIFSSVFAYQNAGSLTLTIHDETALANGEYVSGGYFGGLGIAPAAGRLLGADDDRTGADPGVMMTSALAERRFGGVDAAVGQKVQVNNQPFIVVGIVPPTFYGTDPGVTPDLYLPLHASFVVESSRPIASVRARFDDPGEAWLEIMARLKRGVTIERAQATLAPPFQQFTQHVKDAGKRWNQAPSLALVPGAQGIDGLRRGYSTPLLLLMGLAGLILLLACSNMANLLVARSAARAREIAVRMSLGAPRARVVRQLVTESLVLSGVGGLVGVGIALVGLKPVTSFLTNGQAAFVLRADVNWRVLFFAMGLSLATGLLFGLMPAFRSTRRVILPSIRDARTTPVAGSNRRSGLVRVMVILQIAATLVLLVVSGLFARTLAGYASLDLGFNPDRVLTVMVNARQAGLDANEARVAYENLRQRFAGMPGVVAVGLSDTAIMGDGQGSTMVFPRGQDKSGKDGAPILNVGPGFFSAMEVPVIKGRAIDERDSGPGARPVVVVSEAYAREFFGDANPLGQSVVFPTDSERFTGVGFEIVGIAHDARSGRLQIERPPLVYVPYNLMISDDLRQMVFSIRTASDPAGYQQAVRQIVHDENSRMPISRMATQAALIDRMLVTPILLTRLCVTFAVLALTIAIIGLYGSVAYDVLRRTPEIGVRVALGARRGQIIRLVLGNVLMLAAAGIAIGVPGALYASTFAKAYLFGVTNTDPLTIAGATSVLIVAALIAAYAPARAAARLDPTTALRRD